MSFLCMVCLVVLPFTCIVSYSWLFCLLPSTCLSVTTFLLSVNYLYCVTLFLVVMAVLKYMLLSYVFIVFAVPKYVLFGYFFLKSFLFFTCIVSCSWLYWLLLSTCFHLSCNSSFVWLFRDSRMLRKPECPDKTTKRRQATWHKALCGSVPSGIRTRVVGWR